ncbi:MAG: amidase family protein [Gammaproteobacteria bacterium]|nr:amidase family protein [Gammaproteobacteria bacterium]
MNRTQQRRQWITLLAILALPAASLADTLDLTSATIHELNEAIDAGALTSEQLVEMSLARIAAYDDSGPAINAVLYLNPNALERARELDAERAATGRRSRLHGIPVVIKDNHDTADMPTTAGSFMLKDSIPPDDAFLVKQLRDAGAIILAKLNMSEFASGGAMNSLDGPTYNPHDPSRTPSGSSGGTGAAIAAAYASIGLGTDTGGSVRGPSSANGIVGLKPTLGLLSRDGIIPLALSFDTAGPMARSVYDVATALGVMTGVDPADAATMNSDGKFEKDYTQFLDADALDGARIGVARDFMESDEEVDWIVEAALEAMRDAGAEIVDVELPEWLMESRGKFYRAIRYREFRAQIADYLATTGPDYPKTLEELVKLSKSLTARREDGVVPNPGRWQLMLDEVESGELTDYEYVAVRDHALPLVRSIIGGLIEAEELDAIVYPTAHMRPQRVDPDPDPEGAPGSGGSPVTIANLTGFPDLIVPAGFTGRGLPVSISFLGPAFSEPRLLALGYAFEQRTKARRLPVTTPPLARERITY